MNEITLTRTIFTDQSTIGKLIMPDTWTCYTLEDTCRKKPNHDIAIPIGKYPIIIDKSVRFKRLMPHIINVPGRSGIRIHSGNTDKDTSGCILVGLDYGDDIIYKSKLAFDIFMDRFRFYLKEGKECFIRISGGINEENKP